MPTFVGIAFKINCLGNYGLDICIIFGNLYCTIRYIIVKNLLIYYMYVCECKLPIQRKHIFSDSNFCVQENYVIFRGNIVSQEVFIDIE